MSEHTGGTVTYHEAEWIGEKIKPIYPWMVRFMEDGPIHEITAAEGEAMGLTVPEPAPLVVECNGHRIELSDEQVRAIQADPHGDRHMGATGLLAGLLRDARQDPQPTVDTPSDDIDFALPIGTVLQRGDSIYIVQAGAQVALLHPQTGQWHTMPMATIAAIPTPMRVVYQPPVLSPRQCLEALLAGRDDADELIAWAEADATEYEGGHLGHSPWSQWRRAIGDAARGGA